MQHFMKCKPIIICLIGMCMHLNINAQKAQPFQGTIQYSVQMKYQNTTDTIAITCYYGDKYNKAVADFKGMEAQLIQDLTQDTAIILLNMMGMKMAMPMPTNMKQDKKENILAQAISTDTICEYACKKYLVFSFSALDSNHITITPSPMLADTITLTNHANIQSYTININDSNQINISDNSDISKLLAQNWQVHMWAMLSEDLYINNIMSKLIPLPAHQGVMQFTMAQNNIDINIKAVQVKPGKINKKVFAIDKSYAYNSIDALRSWLPVQP